MTPGMTCGRPRPGSTNSRVPELQVRQSLTTCPAGLGGTIAEQARPVGHKAWGPPEGAAGVRAVPDGRGALGWVGGELKDLAVLTTAARIGCAW